MTLRVAIPVSYDLYLECLLDLYLLRQFDADILAQKKAALEQCRVQLIAGVNALDAHPEKVLSTEAVKTMQALALELRKKAAFATKRQILELLDVEVRVEQTAKGPVANVKSRIGVGSLYNATPVP